VPRRGKSLPDAAGSWLGAVWMSGADPAVFDSIASSAAWFDVTPGRAERRS